jgi:ribosome recycling factor
MLDDIIDDVGRHMDVSITVLERELNAVRTGRASTSFVENLMVNVYGGTSPLNTIATLAVPEARLLVVQPWDKSVISDIERAIDRSELGITPSNDGAVIRLPFPALSADRRRDLVKVVKSKVEEAKVAIRNIRRDAQDDIREAEHEKICSQDQARKAQEDLQALTDGKIERLGVIGDRKQEEILEV